MSDELTPTPSDMGQAAPAPAGPAGPAPVSPDGQGQAPHGQDAGQAAGTQPTDEPSFFDPNSVPAELLPAYKQMQGAFTAKTQEIARQRQKIEAYDAFMQDPVGQMQRLAQQYGLSLTRAQAAQAVQAQQQVQDWQPQTWDEVMTEAERRAEARIMERLGPMFGQVQQMQARTVEQQLNQIDGNWRDYEGQMRHLLQTHPTLVNDVGMLYRMAVPPEILESKAIQGALKRLEEKGQHAKVTQQGSAPRGKPAPPQVKSFEDAVQAAKLQIASGE